MTCSLTWQKIKDLILNSGFSGDFSVVDCGGKWYYVRSSSLTDDWLQHHLFTVPTHLNLLYLPHIYSVFVFSYLKILLIISVYVSSLWPPPPALILPSTSPLSPLSLSPLQSVLKHSSAADLNRGRSRIKRRLIDGLFGLQRRGIVVWLWDEVRGHSPESPRQKPDHNRRPIIMHCCWAPAGTPPSLSPAGHSERSGPPARKTWWDAPLIKHLLLH